MPLGVWGYEEVFLTGDLVAKTPIFFFSIGSVILALKVERLVNALDSFRVFVFR